MRYHYVGVFMETLCAGSCHRCLFHLFYRLTQVMQVLVTTFCSLRESCHKCLFNLFYKCLQVVTSGPVDLRKPA